MSSLEALVTRTSEAHPGMTRNTQAPDAAFGLIRATDQCNVVTRSTRGDGSISRLPLRPRMRGVVDLGQVLEIQVRVDLGGGDIGVAQQLLHAAQVA